MYALKATLCKRLFVVLLTLCSTSSYSQLSANFTALPTSGCAPLLVSFFDSSTGNPTNWRWDLGNGTISFLQNPSVTYFNPGQYSVKLVILNSSGADSVTKTQFINVHFPPAITFSGNPVSGCFPLPVHFTDQSSPGSGSINSWEWDFGDGNIAGTQNPSHTYTGAGAFNVSLRVTNTFGCAATITKPNYINISSGVQALFSNSSPNSCNPPLTVNFQNQSIGTGALTYQWSFGDGSNSTVANPAHLYTTMGNYTVRLIVTNSVGCVDTITRVNAVNVGAVHADFTLPATVCQGQFFSLTNTSVPAPTTVFWDFNDGITATTINAVKSFTATGTHTIKMVANFSGCSDSATKTINVLAKPVITFSGDQLTSCRPPLSVNFTSSVAGAVSYAWNFGDGSTSASQNPSHTYTSYGTYTVKLIATNSSGCSDSVIKTGYIQVTAPHVTIPGLPIRGCSPFPYTFSTNVVTVDPVVSYAWDFGDGSFSTLPNPSHTFTSGSYTIKVVITTQNGCKDSITVVNGIIVNNKPHANFSANPRDVCAFFSINFSDLSTGGADQWLWNFGDGGSSTAQNPVYQYGDTGTFHVQLIVWHQGCADTIKFLNYIHIKPPIAVFTPTLDCTLPKVRSFTDHSIGADTWDWDFGDGTSSNIQNPVHTYASPGNYIAKLTVTNLSTGCQHSTTANIQIITEKANFTTPDTVICKGSPVNFQTVNINPLNISTYKWIFGDGATSNTSDDSAKHIYSVSGTYTVTLIIIDLNGCADTLVKPLYIRVNGPTALFSSLVTGSCLNTPITFNDSSYTDGVHPIQSWTWNYGDGFSETLVNGPFVHSFTSPGQYTISLRLIDSNGCLDSIIRPQYITISKPIASFTADTISCTSGIINFVNNSTGPNLIYNWNLGDGTTSTVANPVHLYATQGIYSVSLQITDQYGCTDNIIKSNYIKIADAHAEFSMSDSVTTCPPLVVNFTNTSSNLSTRSWDFGDGTTSSLDNPTHFYTSAGTYHVLLSITGPGGCTDTKTKTILVRGPQGSFSYTHIMGCNPLTTNFVATTHDNLSFIWDYNDGTTIATFDSVRVHTYNSPGTYIPKIILIDTIGCHVPIVGTDTIHVYGVQASVSASALSLCDSGSISFAGSAISNDLISAYRWNFSDGTSSSLQNPSHQFNITGIYTAQLVVTSQFGCQDSISLATPIKVVASPQVAINGSNGACIPATINFSGQMLIPDTSLISWTWNFGNGNTSSLQNPPSQTYSLAGVYNISMVAVNSSGCKDSVVKSIEAYPLPSVVASADSWICKGQNLNISASGASSYNWSPSAGLSCNNCFNPVAHPDTTTRYVVNGTSLQGCVGKDTVLMSVQQPFQMFPGRGDTICKGSSVHLGVIGGTSYIWSPVTGLNNPLIAQPVATPAVTTTYMVIGSDSLGCFKDTGYVPVKVWPVPTVSAGLDKTINVGQSVDLVPLISNDVTSVNWNPTTGVFRNIYPGVTVRPTQTTEYTVKVSNPGGCKATDKVTVFVICNNANVFIPNTFSPNGDGMNDKFYIRGSGLFTIKTLRIFNRWGQVVFEKSNVRPNEVSDGWDGTLNGQKLNPDVFVYTVDVVCDNNTPLRFQGNIALIR